MSNATVRPATATTVYTIGYGGRAPQEFVGLLTRHGVRTIVDVRLRPDRASMGAYVLAKNPGKGIQALLSRADIGYVSMIQLGNIFLSDPAWQLKYQRLLAAAGDVLVAPLLALPADAQPVCLLCAERAAADCHRTLIAEYLTTRGCTVHAII